MSLINTILRFGSKRKKEDDDDTSEEVVTSGDESGNSNNESGKEGEDISQLAMSLAGPMGMAAAELQKQLNEGKEFAKDNLSMMGAMGKSMIASNALANLTESEQNAAYKRSLAQKSYDSIQMMQKGGTVQLFEGDPPEGDPLGIFTNFQDLINPAPKKDLYDSEYFGKFKVTKDRIPMEDFKNMTKKANDYYLKIFQFGLPEVEKAMKVAYNGELGDGASEKLAEYIKMVLANENSYGQGKENIEYREYTSGFISADKGGYPYDFMDKMLEAMDRIGDKDFDSLGDVDKSYVMAYKMLEELGVDPRNKQEIFERIEYGEPIVSMAMVAAQGVRGLSQAGKGGPEKVDGIIIPEEARTEAASMHKNKKYFMNASLDDKELFANMFLNSWNTWGNLRKRDFDPKKSVSEAIKSYSFAKNMGWSEGTAENPIKQKTLSPEKTVDMLYEERLEEEAKEAADKKEVQNFFDSYSRIDSDKTEGSLMNGYSFPFPQMKHGGMLDKLESYGKTSNEIGKVVSFKSGGKISKGIIIGYKDDKPVIRKYTSSQSK